MRLLLSLFLLAFSFTTTAQVIYRIPADTVKIYKRDSTNAELVLENGTRTVKGFLFNTGNGRTVFKQGLVKLNDTTYIIGADTLFLSTTGITVSSTWGTITGTLSSQTDLQTALNLKLNISDTAAMLAPYLRKFDTALMLLPYLRKADTAAMLSPYLRRSDTTGMLLPYLRKTDTTGKWIGIGWLATLAAKQDALVSGTNIKSVNSNSLLGSGNLTSDDLLPSQSGANGKVLQSNGTNASWQTPSGSNADSSASRIRRGTFAQRPSAPDTGQIYFQTDRLAGKWEYDGAKWDFIGAPLQFSHFEQFSNPTISVPQLGGSVSGTGASGSIAEAVGLGSYAVLTTGTTSSGYATYGFQNAGTFILTLDSMIQYQENRVMLPVLGTAGENFNVAVGWLGHQNTWTFGSALFWYNYSSGGGVWQTFTRKYDNTGTMTYKVTSVTVAANQWYRLGILVNGYTQTIQFYIDDVLVQTHSTALGDNIPMPGSTVSSQYNFGITKTAGTTARSLYIDHSFLYYIKRKYQ